MSGVDITSVSRGAEQTLGTVSGILEAADSPLFQDDIARMFYSYMSQGLDVEYRNLAMVNPERYGHMYDWNMLGRPAGKLWKHYLSGGPGSRVVTYSFVPSKAPVPATTPENTGISAEDFPNLRNNGRYMFPNKAMVFESGMTTRIAPRNAKALFVPLRHKTRNGWKESNYRGELTDRDKRRGYVWVKTPVTQEHKATMGAFTQFYLSYYASNADRVFSEKVEPRVNARIKKVYTSRMPNLGGSVNVSHTKTQSRRFNVTAAADASRIANAEMKREMAAAVRSAIAGTEMD